MTQNLEKRCAALLETLGIASAHDIQSATPLTGGVASDIAVVKLADRAVCVKFALPKLRVAADWFAPVHRNAAEYAWLEVAAQIAPESAVEVYGLSEDLHGFAMEFLEPASNYLWKLALLREDEDKGEAAKVGDLIGRIHQVSAQPDFDSAYFQNRDDFRALRIEPYLTYLQSVYPELDNQLGSISNTLYETSKVLIHGDVSPKNILFRSGSPIILDAECATMGDACFDVSFSLNHLILKAVHLPKSRQRLLQDALKLWEAYSAYIDWESPEELESRICHLLPALMLARVDGKSPVEYLDEAHRVCVRQISRALIKHPKSSLFDLIATIRSDLQEIVI